MLTAALLFSASACRQRITDIPPVTEAAAEPQTPEQPEMPEDQSDEPIQTPQPTTPPESPPPTAPAETITEQFEVEINMAEPEVLELLPDAEAPDSATERGNGESSSELPPAAGEAGSSTVQLPESSDVAGETNLTDSGTGTLGTIIDQYTTLLSSGLGSLYECEKGYIYYERVTDYQTVNRSSAEHSLIVESGGYNVAEKLSGDALTVDSGWILRKNPTVIVKCVGAGVLGGGITSSGRAETVANEILTRPGLEISSSVINRSVVLISEELLSSDDGRLLAKLYIANAMYPSLFSEVELAEFYELIKASGGVDFTTGLFHYAV